MALAFPLLLRVTRFQVPKRSPLGLHGWARHVQYEVSILVRGCPRAVPPNSVCQAELLQPEKGPIRW
ncbi:hypothetical protein MA16_Dca027212 [Dendrobium catenatum]|uniref:Uncharacterized protein n=1 Tax=Dendrobium catenatum TaxID=906689 RepID=A0A2I0VF07_9ASPA|nr:hypothetical protein MA16_Dca027212 [Dendrobium catenatum]